jgi:hypothetical protein
MSVTIIVPAIIMMVPSVTEIKIENHRRIPAIVGRIPAAIIIIIIRIITPVTFIVWIISVIAPITVIISHTKTYSPGIRIIIPIQIRKDRCVIVECNVGSVKPVNA